VDDEVADGALGVPGLMNRTAEERWLRVLIDAAERAASLDSKLRYLQRLIRRLGSEPIVIFTEYRDTLQALAAVLPPAMQLHGGMSGSERAAVQAAFNREGGRLLATDAAAEGLNLHGCCRIAVNFELPWNPARLEQRIGRIDRIGQPRTVHAITMTARDTAEHVVIAALVRRLTRIVRTLGTRDRLGAFLDEARMAQVVIGQGPAPAADREDDPDVAGITLAPLETTAEERRASAQIQARAPDHRRAVLVTHLRCGTVAAPGVVVVVVCTARSADGIIAARTAMAVHVKGTPARPESARHVRTLASTFLDGFRMPVAALDAWFRAVRRLHEESVRSTRDRLDALQASASGMSLPVQPGLFDRRAESAMASLRRTEDRLFGEYVERVQALERSRELELVCEPAALLIAWR
jgi:hypothetical protein